MRADPGKILYRKITVDLSAGADCDAIDDATEAVGEIPFPDIFEQCPAREEGKQCVYNWRTNFTDCIHCRMTSGLDE